MSYAVNITGLTITYYVYILFFFHFSRFLTWTESCNDGCLVDITLDVDKLGI